jgi:hypothetical protein
MLMKRRRRATLVAGGALLAAWAAAASLPEGPAPPAPAPVRSSEAAAGGRVEADAVRLRARLAEPRPGLGPSVRNPFRFSRRAPAQARPGPDAGHAAALAAPAVPPPLPLVLAGIAEQDAAGNPQRTAVISDFAHLYLVKEGDAVTDRYRVERVGADAVELRDGLTGATLRLGLR